MNIIEKLNEIKACINKQFSNSYLNKIQQINQNDFVFSFSKNSDESLLISLNLKNPFIQIVEDKLLFNNPSAFSNKLRQKIVNSLLINCEVINEDNILCLNLLKTTDTYDKIEYKLFIELFKSNSNIILVHDNKIIEALRLKNLETKRPILINMTYELPLKISLIKEYDSDLFIKDYIDSIEENYLKDKYNSLHLEIKRKLKSLNKKYQKLEEDKNKIETNLKYKEYGDYLLTEFSNVKKGDKYILINGEEIKLKENLTPSQNLEYFYKIYKKAKTGIELNKKYLTDCQNEITYLNSIINQIDIFNENDYEEIIEELSKNNILKSKFKQTFNKKIKSSYMPYYVLFNDTKIGFGKNSSQNNELTFKIAKKNNYFLHIDKNHGSHIVIFNENPTNEEKQFASELALKLSKMNDGDVCFSSIKNIKKSSVLGKVIMLEYETFHINKFKYKIENYLKNAKRF